MKAYEIQKFGLENLKLAERDTPKPGPGQVLIKVRACSLNFRDLLMVKGQYNPRQPLPLIPCSDGAGEVVAVDAGVSRVKVGDRVAGIFAQKWIAGEPTQERVRSTLGGPFDGMLTEYALLGEEGVVKIPAHLSFEEAATLPCAALTAWCALTKYRPLLAGQTLLLQGTGGVSIFALQFAKILGATVIITSSSDEKLERAKALGADHLINYKIEPDWHKKARELTGKIGVDHVLEVGGAGTFEKALAATRIGGFVVSIGVLSGVAAPLSLTSVFMSGLTVQGMLVGNRDDFEAMNRAIAQHGLKPVVDRAFAFADVHQAFALMEQGGHFGKIVVRVD
ncbi:MAG: NAD(P)-dependent alcohol dehydrogenase [Gammaproteobacteria bacterium]